MNGLSRRPRVLYVATRLKVGDSGTRVVLADRGWALVAARPCSLGTVERNEAEMESAGPGLVLRTLPARRARPRQPATNRLSFVAGPLRATPLEETNRRMMRARIDHRQKQ